MQGDVDFRQSQFLSQKLVKERMNQRKNGLSLLRLPKVRTFNLCF